MTPHTATLAEEGDISSLCQYGWYECCYYCEHTTVFPHNDEVLGQVLGSAQGEGNEMAPVDSQGQWVHCTKVILTTTYNHRNTQSS